jgi:hypothetical protein
VTPNPYAPPKSEVADVVRGEVAPSLWNANAAAGWSLLFSPAFGAFVHMKNWQALGEPTKASAAKTWGISSLVALGVVSVASALLPDSKAIDGLSRIAMLALLLSWYYTSGRPQAALIKARFGDRYPRRGWAKPLLLALAALAVFIAVMVAVGLAFEALTTEG